MKHTMMPLLDALDAWPSSRWWGFPGFVLFVLRGRLYWLAYMPFFIWLRARRIARIRSCRQRTAPSRGRGQEGEG